METIKERESEISVGEAEGEEEESKEEQLNRLLKKVNIDLTALANSTESIGHRNVSHRRTQSTSLFSMLDAPITMRHRARSLSLAELPDLTKYYPGSHLLDGLAEQEHSGCLYLSLWLLPPLPLRTQLAKEIAQLAMKYASQGSSPPFMPHVTIIGSIRADSHRDVEEIAQKLQQGLQHTGLVPCRFVPNQPCKAMVQEDNTLVWSQSCIAIMERSPEYMKLLAKARQILELPLGEWMFPGPACEPHLSKFYGKYPIPNMEQDVDVPPDFLADQAALYMTTHGTLEGVGKWRKVTIINLR
jgi:hypothetical protein